MGKHWDVFVLEIKWREYLIYYKKQFCEDGNIFIAEFLHSRSGF